MPLFDGTPLDDDLTGTGLGDILQGFTGDDRLFGLGGDDRLAGGAGADELTGGPGNDTALYSGSMAAVTVDLLPGTGTGGSADGDLLRGIENLAGSRHADQLLGDGSDNRLTGGQGNDALIGRAGNDLLVGGSGGDAMDGGNGFDMVSYQRATGGASVNLRNDQMLGAAAGDYITRVEALRGSNFGDSLIMGDGDNLLQGRGGDDFLDGGNGNDRLAGGAGADFLHGGTGIDTANYRSSDAGVNATLNSGSNTGGHAQGDVLSWIENLTGSGHDDQLTGDILDNRLRGLDGDDILIGRGGDDDLFGGAGADSFAFVDLADHGSQTHMLTDILTRQTGGNRIRDFDRAEDLLQFDSAVFSGAIHNTGTIGDLGLDTAGDSAFAFTDRNLFYVTHQGTDGMSQEVFEVHHITRLKGVTALDASDFLFV